MYHPTNILWRRMLLMSRKFNILKRLVSAPRHRMRRHVILRRQKDENAPFRHHHLSGNGVPLHRRGEKLGGDPHTTTSWLLRPSLRLIACNCPALEQQSSRAVLFCFFHLFLMIFRRCFAIFSFASILGFIKFLIYIYF